MFSSLSRRLTRRRSTTKRSATGLLTTGLLATSLLATGLLATGCQGDEPASQTPQKTRTAGQTKSAKADESPPSAATSPMVGDAGKFIERLDGRIAMFKKRAKSDKGSWVDDGRVAQAYLTRARLTSDWDDYKHADKALTRAFDAAPGKSGPMMSQLSFDGAVHHFDQLEDHLDKLKSRPATGKSPIAVASVEASVKLQNGHTDQAITQLQKLYDHAPSTGVGTRLAHLYFKTGRPEKADALYKEAVEQAKSAKAMNRAWIALQQAIFDLERGRYDDAMVDLKRADKTFSGWYLVEEHIAEVLARTGKTDQAIAKYRDIVSRVPNGEFYDALAAALETAGRADEAKQARQQAKQAYKKDLEAFPTAAYGHAVGHYLVHGPTATALDLARKNWKLRPTPEARVILIQALIRSGQLDEAQKHTKKVLASTWQTAKMHATAARVFELAGDQENAKKHRQKANELWPNSAAEYAWLTPAEKP